MEPSKLSQFPSTLHQNSPYNTTTFIPSRNHPKLLKTTAKNRQQSPAVAVNRRQWRSTTTTKSTSTIFNKAYIKIFLSSSITTIMTNTNSRAQGFGRKTHYKLKNTTPPICYLHPKSFYLFWVVERLTKVLQKPPKDTLNRWPEKTVPAPPKPTAWGRSRELLPERGGRPPT